jgi:hypothetical protein
MQITHNFIINSFAIDLVISFYTLEYDFIDTPQGMFSALSRQLVTKTAKETKEIVKLIARKKEKTEETDRQ